MGRVARRTLPRPPSAPELPATPFPHRRTEVPGTDLEIRPFAGPEIEIPSNEDEELLKRFDAWHARTNGSLPEYIVYEFLVFEKKQIEGIDFFFQHPQLGGRTEFGGFVLDFFFPAKDMGWRVMGDRYHLLQAEDRGRDLMAKALLEGRGIKIIDLWEEDLLTRKDLVLRLAWEGSELQRPID